MSIYEEVEIEDLEFDAEKLLYTYPCPCGDRFRITLEELYEGEDVAKCPSFTHQIKVIFQLEDLPEINDDDANDEEEGLTAKLNEVTVDS